MLAIFAGPLSLEEMCCRCWTGLLNSSNSSSASDVEWGLNPVHWLSWMPIMSKGTSNPLKIKFKTKIKTNEEMIVGFKLKVLRINWNALIAANSCNTYQMLTIYHRLNHWNLPRSPFAKWPCFRCGLLLYLVVARATGTWLEVVGPFQKTPVVLPVL